MATGSKPTFREAVRFWLKLGCIGFGGPAGQIVIMHRELVERRQWITEADFEKALNFCMLLPGPEAQQLATWCGWRLHGTKGGVAAGALFVLPAAFLLLALSWLYMAGGHLPWLADVFRGLAAAVVALLPTRPAAPATGSAPPAAAGVTPAAASSGR